jgi:F-type H+-transporting ATPase subunit epsilon
MSDNEQTMHLKILLPTEELVDETVLKVIAEADNGVFCLLPRHIDFVATLVPGILVFLTEPDHMGPDYGKQSKENFAAVDEGVLVKCGRSVFVSTLNGVRDTDLSRLQSLVEERFLELDEHERKTRSALARLEAGTLRGFRQMQEILRG